MKLNRKDKIIAVRIDQDTLIVLDAFKISRGWKYSKTMRTALENYLKYVIEQEDAIVKQKANMFSSNGICIEKYDEFQK